MTIGQRHFDLAGHDLNDIASGELPQLSARVPEAVRLIVENRPVAISVIVGHDSGNRVLLQQGRNLPFSAWRRIARDLCGLSGIAVTDDIVFAHRINDTADLESREIW
jgi:hypothetical protein